VSYAVNGKPQQILVVGGAGYVGCVLTETLVHMGYDVHILDRLYFGDYGIEPVKDHITLTVGDMRHVVPSLFEDIDAVINVGGLSNDPTAEFNSKANHEMNTVATETLARMCREAGVPRFVFASTASVYDTGIIDSETDDIVQTEETPVNPHSAYASSKREAEKRLLALKDDKFCPVVLRKGTIFGFSPRMRYDLVINAFVKDAMSQGQLNIFAGGEMWRPLVDIQDVARAYTYCLDADAELVRGQIFNLNRRNYRISELGLWVREVLDELGIYAEIHVTQSHQGLRSYRISSEKIKNVLGFSYHQDIEHSVDRMVSEIKKWGYTDFDNPRYYNIRWMKLLQEAGEIIGVTGDVW
jgi:nucleoside-diphosphate-sugar epimerase